ncbi:hypothetical protein [Demequina globuliformis]|uniref:hypothetical protein n=1 Tax=Demequina globuliformis TaxID=676202 RepID=UPI0007821BA4|nr:hypothetical protein [Demequina globuliformis]
MAQEKSDGTATPWLPINGEREPVAPSKPSVPSTGSVPVVPQSIEGDDGEIIPPVAQPDQDEIMPGPGSNPWRPGDQTASPTEPDAIRELGDSAVRSASLSASGAPTPLGGVPLVTSVQPGKDADGVRPAWAAGDPGTNAPDAASPWSARTPTEGSPETPESPVSPGSGPSTDSAATPDEGADAWVATAAGAAVAAERSPDTQEDEEPTQAMPVHDFGDDQPAYEPEVIAASAPSQDGSGTEPPKGIAERDGGTPWYAGAPFLIAVGLLVLGGIGFAAYQLFFAPEDVELTPEVLVEAPPEATLDPITLDEPTDFLAAMPGTVGTFAMTAASPVEADDAGLTARAAEVNDVTYSDGTTDMTVRAIQHYNEDDATEQYTALAEGGTDPQPVMVGDTEAGERVTLEGDPTTYVWRNGTAVFELTGPADQIEAFYAQFPL